MGCTGSKHQKVANKIIKKYGKTNALEFAIQQEKKQLIDQNFPTIKSKLDKAIDEETKKAIKKIDNKQNEIENQYKERLNKIQKVKKGSIGKAEQLHKQQAEKLFGLDQIRQNLYNLRVNTKVSYHNQYQKINKIVDQKINAYKTTELNKFKVQEYDDLQKDQQSHVRECIKKKYQDKAEEQIIQFKVYLQDNFNYQNYSKNFAKINPQNQLIKIQEKTDKSFNAGQQKVAGSAGCATC